jgi:hypothetical protein
MDVTTAYDADIMFRRWLMEHMGTPDDKDVDFADMFIGGVPGALTDTEISSTVSLDLVNMWYREPIAGDSLESSMIATAIQNIAGLSMATQFIRGTEALYEGDIADGLKKTLPAFFRSWVTAYVNETEGVKNRKGDTIVPKEDLTGADAFRSVLGARSGKLARWQDYYITAGKNEKRIKAEKQDILDDLEDKIRSGDIKSKEGLREFWKEEIEPFNRTYPNEDFVITEDTIIRSMKGRSARSERNVQGLQVSKKSKERRERAAEPFMIKKPTEYKKPPPGRSASGGSINQREGASSGAAYNYIRQIRKPLIPDLVSTTLRYTTFSFNLRSTGRISFFAALGSRHGKKSDAPFVKARQFIS